jgi:hypothetical protein
MALLNKDMLVLGDFLWLMPEDGLTKLENNL